MIYNEEKLIRLYKDKIKISLILEKIGISRTHLYRVLAKNNIKIIGHADYIRGKSPWNKGLTKEDDRVRINIEKSHKTRLKDGSYKSNSGSFKKGDKRCGIKKGSKNPKLSIIKKQYYKEGKIKKLIGSKNPSWKGDRVGIGSVHQWMANNKPKPLFCEKCNKEKKLELSNTGHTYKRNIEDYEWLCRSCHRKKDYKNKKNSGSSL